MRVEYTRIIGWVCVFVGGSTEKQDMDYDACQVSSLGFIQPKERKQKE